MQEVEPMAKREKIDVDDIDMEVVQSEAAVLKIQDTVDELGLDEELKHMSVEDIIGRTRLLEGEIRIMRSECQRITHEMGTLKDKIKVSMFTDFSDLIIAFRFF